ncbi:MAG TPA: radical SAM family heme chaperone HemW [Rickettsiales bacterium]|nr:radical SAM family heme chaperone HemW [Rickettsiales bacterium]
MSRPLSIYIHWPFCKSKCPYCDFNSHVRASVDNARWQKALLAELAYYAQKLPQRQVVSIFFGGGTPSLMPPETVASLIDATAGFWPMIENAEITLEANPTSVEAQKFRDFRASGVNRVSVGVQALNATDLKFLGREHSTDEALQALALARDSFPRMSFDLIYARPGQTLAAWESELTQALEYACDHLSLYQLTIEENTAFHHIYHNGGFLLPEEGLAADMYMLTQSVMEAHGLPAYEISNHAKPGGESHHNMAYWQSQDYIGIGAGAHGRYSIDYGGNASPIPALPGFPREVVASTPPRTHAAIRYATENIKSPERWLEQVERTGAGLSIQTEIPAEESLEEAVLMGLRLSDGINYRKWQERTGLDLHAALSPVAIQRLQTAGLVEADAQRIRTTPEGRLLLNSVTRELLAELP